MQSSPSGTGAQRHWRPAPSTLSPQPAALTNNMCLNSLCQFQRQFLLAAIMTERAVGHQQLSLCLRVLALAAAVASYCSSVFKKALFQAVATAAAAASKVITVGSVPLLSP